MRLLPKLLLEADDTYHPQPEAFNTIDYWGKYIQFYDKTWNLFALKVYAEWRLNRSSDRRTFLAKFLDEKGDIFEERLNSLGVVNHLGVHDCIFKMSYVLTHFYYIFDSFYVTKDISIEILSDNERSSSAL